MPWCPKCKNEYVEGIRKCTDCGLELVESLEEEKRTDTGDNPMWQEVPDDIPQSPAAAAFKGVYQSNIKKAEENRSSAYMLMIIGGIGLIIVILFLLGIINIALFASNKYMVCGGMGFLFAVFFVMGVISLKSSKTFEQRAKEENNLTTEMKKWCEENMTAAVIDEIYSADKDELAAGEDSEEVKYFKRTERMREMINHQFVNLDEGFLDAFIDEYYPAIFD